MKKKSFYLCSLFAAALLFTTSCSDSEVTPGEGGEGEFKVKFTFSGETATPGARAAVTTYVPVTNWGSVTNLKVLLYDNATKTIKLAREISIPAPGSGAYQETFSNIVADTYTVVAIANTTQSGIFTYGTDGANHKVWNAADMIGKKITDMKIAHATTTFPTHAATAMASKTALMEPAEIFTGSATATIASGGTATAAVNLTRDVSLMRLRLNVKHANVSNVNWTTGANANVFIYRIPKELSIAATADGGGVSAALANDHVQVAAGYDLADDSALPAGSTGSVQTDNDFTLWKDIVVFPNNGGRAGTAAQSKYFIAISATAGAGHIYADGTPAAAGDAVYWYNVIDGPDGSVNEDLFLPNKIREVNLTVTTGGYSVIPPNPQEYGNITVTVNEPLNWDSNIDKTEIEV